jgi:2-C-methyl-D-erythritol 4-phosphate cytidylyltransferase
VAAIAGVIAAAGRGERLGSELPKALVELAGRPLVSWAAAALVPVCDVLVVVVPPEVGAEPFRAALAGSGVPLRLVAGGEERALSVRAGFAAAGDAEAVVVHDAARPFATPLLARACLDALADADAAIAATPLVDTVKESSDGRYVERTLDRSRLWAVQTPQAFRADALRAALALPDAVVRAATDEAALVERCGGRVRLVPASPRNFKITVRDDLELAAALAGVAASGSRE